MLKAAKAQLYLRKVASACRIVKYNRAVSQMNKEAASFKDWADAGMGIASNLGGKAWNAGMNALNSGAKTVARGANKAWNTMSTAATNTAQKISDTASQVGQFTQDALGAMNHSLSGQTTPYYNNAALRQPVRPQGTIPQAPTPAPSTNYSSPVTDQDQRDLARVRDMTEDAGYGQSAYIPDVQFPASGMTLQPSTSTSAQPDQTVGEEEPTPMMGQTTPYIPEISTPVITPPPVSKPTQRVSKNRKRTQNTQVAQSSPEADTAFFDSLSPEQQERWIVYSHGNGRRNVYPTSYSDLNMASDYYDKNRYNRAKQKYYVTAPKIVANRRNNLAKKRQANQ